MEGKNGGGGGDENAYFDRLLIYSDAAGGATVTGTPVESLFIKIEVTQN